MLLPGFWGFASARPISSHFTQLTHFPYSTGTLPAVALVVNPRVGVFVYVLSLCGPFKRTSLKIQQFLLPPQPPLIFTARRYGDLSSWHWNPGLGGLVWCYDPLLRRYPSRFLSTTCGCGTTHSESPHLSASLPLLRICMSVFSILPWLLDLSDDSE